MMCNYVSITKKKLSHACVHVWKYGFNYRDNLVVCGVKSAVCCKVVACLDFVFCEVHFTLYGIVNIV